MKTLNEIRDVRFKSLRKGVRDMIYEYLDNDDMKLMKKIILFSEFTKQYIRKEINSKLYIDKLDIDLNFANDSTNKTAKEFYCCLSLFPVYPNSIAYTMKRDVFIQDVTDGVGKKIFPGERDSTSTIRMMDFKKLNVFDEEIYCLVLVDQDSTVKIIETRGFSCVQTFKIEQNYYWHLEAIETNNLTVETDIIVSGDTGIGLFRGKIGNEFKCITDIKNSSIMFFFIISNGLIFCGDYKFQLHIIELSTFSKVLTIADKDFQYYVRGCCDLNQYKKNHIAIGIEQCKNAVIIMKYNFNPKTNEVDWRIEDKYNLDDVIITVFYLKFKFRNYIIAGSGEQKSRLFIIDIDKKTVIYDFHLGTRWVNHISLHREDLLMVTGYQGIHFYKLK